MSFCYSSFSYSLITDIAQTLSLPTSSIMSQSSNNQNSQASQYEKMDFLLSSPKPTPTKSPSKPTPSKTPAKQPASSSSTSTGKRGKGKLSPISASSKAEAEKVELAMSKKAEYEEEMKRLKKLIENTREKWKEANTEVTLATTLTSIREEIDAEKEDSEAEEIPLSKRQKVTKETTSIKKVSLDKEKEKEKKKKEQ